MVQKTKVDKNTKTTSQSISVFIEENQRGAYCFWTPMFYKLQYYITFTLHNKIITISLALHSSKMCGANATLGKVQLK